MRGGEKETVDVSTLVWSLIVKKEEKKRVLAGENLRLEESSFNNGRDLSMFNC